MSWPADLLSAENRNRPVRCAIYTRQSRKTESAFSSCEAQEMICQDVAVARFWMVTAVFHDEGASGETLKWPALQQMLAAAEAGEFQQLIIYSDDRLVSNEVYTTQSKVIWFSQALLFQSHNAQLYGCSLKRKS